MLTVVEELEVVVLLAKTVEFPETTVVAFVELLLEMVEFPVMVVKEVELLELFTEAEVVELTMLVAEVVALSLEVVAAASLSSYLKSLRSLLPPVLVVFVVLFNAVELS